MISYLSNLLGIEKPAPQLPKLMVQKVSIQPQKTRPVSSSVAEVPVVEEISKEIIEKQEQEEEKVAPVAKVKYTGNEKYQQRALEAEQKRTSMLESFKAESKEREQAMNFLTQCYEYSFKDDPRGLGKLEKLQLKDDVIALIRNFYNCNADYDSLVKILTALGCSGFHKKGGSSR